MHKICLRVHCWTQTPVINGKMHHLLKIAQDKWKSMCHCASAQSKTKPLKGNTMRQTLLN